jgi:hypothetical protein
MPVLVLTQVKPLQQLPCVFTAPEQVSPIFPHGVEGNEFGFFTQKPF